MLRSQDASEGSVKSQPLRDMTFLDRLRWLPGLKAAVMMRHTGPLQNLASNFHVFSVLILFVTKLVQVVS